jgi:hypothetical protein
MPVTEGDLLSGNKVRAGGELVAIEPIDGLNRMGDIGVAVSQ